MFSTLLVGFLLAFVLTSVGIVGLIPLARRLAVVDRPGGRKWHAAPTPVIGGLAMTIGAGGALCAPLLARGPQMELVGLAGAVLILLAVGHLDDRFGLSWQVRILAHVSAALSISVVGGVKVEQIGAVFGLAPVQLGYMSLPLTVFITVGMINAMNMVDGVDGLAGSLALVALSMAATAAIYAGNIQLTQGLFAFIGAIAAFLMFNARFPWQRRASVFMGNAGSAIIGLIIAWSCFRLTQNPLHPINPLFAPFLIAPALIDCLILITRRLAQHRSPFSADRNHLHHILLDSGFPPSEVVAILTLISLVLGGGAALACKAHVPRLAFAIAFMSVLLLQLALTMRPARAVVHLSRLRLQFSQAPFLGGSSRLRLRGAPAISASHNSDLRSQDGHDRGAGMGRST